MKFNCGPTESERRNRKLAAAREAYEKARKWHKEFLWFPLRIGSGDCRWLEYVETRLRPGIEFTDWWLDHWIRWDHRPIDKDKK